MLRSRALSEGNSKMVGIVESIQEILVEWVNVLQTREGIEDRGEFLAESFLCVFDLSRVEVFCRKDPSVLQLSFTLVSWRKNLLRIRLMANPARICVGSRLWVLERTMSRNSCEVGTGAISFHV
jgi:hypothetical protein